MTTTSLSCGLLVAVLAFPAGCATIVNRSTQPVTIVSEPPAAAVIVGAEEVGTTPTDVRLIRRDSDAALRLQKDGFAPRVVRPRRSLSRWLIGNLVLPAVLSYLSPAAQVSDQIYGYIFAGTAGLAFATDLFVTGAGFTFPDTVRTTLAPAADVSAHPRQQQVGTRLAPDFHMRGVGGERLDAPASPEGPTAVQ